MQGSEEDIGPSLKGFMIEVRERWLGGRTGGKGGRRGKE